MTSRLLALLLVLVAVPCYAADAPTPPVIALYAGCLLTVDQDQGGTLTRGNDLYALRLVVSALGPYGLWLGFRGDLTSLGYISPDSLDLASVRTAEGYGALSWSAAVKGFAVGPAVVAGALVPVQREGGRGLARCPVGSGLAVSAVSSFVPV
jgi:hypothetical protein